MKRVVPVLIQRDYYANSFVINTFSQKKAAVTIQQLNFQAKISISFFLFIIVLATLSSVLLLSLELSGNAQGIHFPTISQIKTKYSTPELVSAMRGSMYEYVAADEDIVTVDEWIKNGALDNGLYKAVREIIDYNCLDCHNSGASGYDAAPSIPFDTYEDIKRYTEAGYSLFTMSRQAHIHLFGIAIFLVVITFIFSYSTYSNIIKNWLIIISYAGCMLDISSWWLIKYNHSFAYVIFIMGGLMVSSILIMSSLALLNIWRKD